MPFNGHEIKQLASGHPVTEAADFLQKTIVENTKDRVLKGLELGSGNGIISFMLALQKPQWKLMGIELQKELLYLAVSNNDKLSLSCSFVEGDIRDFQRLLNHKGFELVYSNPPWIKAGTGNISPDPVRAMSRQEVSCTMKDVLACIEWCLSDNGTAWIIYPQDRKAELALEIQRTGLLVSGMFHSELSPRSFIARLMRKPVSQKW